MIQLSLQIKAFTINADAASILGSIVDAAGTTNNSLPFLNGNILRMCSWVPANLNVDIVSCPVVWNGTAAAAAAATVSGINANAVGMNQVISSSSAVPLSSTASVVQSSSSTSAGSSTISSTQPSTYVSEVNTPASSASVASLSASPTVTPPKATQTITIFTGLPTPTASQAIDTPFDGLDVHGLSNPDDNFDAGFKVKYFKSLRFSTR